MSFSSYLVGTWENHWIQKDKPAAYTSLQIILPINEPPIDNLKGLHVVAVFFDVNGVFLRHLERFLERNAMWEILVAQITDEPVRGKGVVKIFSFDQPYQEGKLTEGIVGFQRHLLAGVLPTSPPDPEAAFSEAPLAAIPPEYAPREWEYVRRMLP